MYGTNNDINILQISSRVAGKIMTACIITHNIFHLWTWRGAIGVKPMLGLQPIPTLQHFMFCSRDLAVIIAVGQKTASVYFSSIFSVLVPINHSSVDL
ncbi:hypothetical protein ACJX0J_029146, partial [Zea mays]